MNNASSNATESQTQYSVVSISLYIVSFLLVSVIVAVIWSMCKRKLQRSMLKRVFKQAQEQAQIHVRAKGTRTLGNNPRKSSAKMTRFERSQGAKSNASSSPGVVIINAEWVAELPTSTAAVAGV